MEPQAASTKATVSIQWSESCTVVIPALVLISAQQRAGTLLSEAGGSHAQPSVAPPGFVSWLLPTTEVHDRSRSCWIFGRTEHQTAASGGRGLTRPQQRGLGRPLEAAKGSSEAQRIRQRHRAWVSSVSTPVGATYRENGRQGGTSLWVSRG